MFEVTGIARGMVVCDAIVKRATVEVLRSHPIDPGKYVILFAGPVAEVEEALDAGEELGSDTILDRLFIPNIHESVMSAIQGAGVRPGTGSIGIVECQTLAGAIIGLDTGLKAAEVNVIELRLGSGLAGKGFFVLTGELHDVEAALEAAMEVSGDGATSEVIASPHPDFLKGAL